MYTPRAFAIEELSQLHELILATRLAILVSHGESGLQASHVPVLLHCEQGEYGTLYGHLARANPQWKDLRDGAEAMLIFAGADAYVSPGFYPSKAEHGKVVPTWNYVTVHAYGRPQIVEDTQGALDVLAKLAAAYEGADASSWGLDRLPPGNAEAQTRGIVAFRMPLARLQTKIKLSQNREMADRQRVIAKLEESDSQDARGTARWMKRVLP